MPPTNGGDSNEEQEMASDQEAPQGNPVLRQLREWLEPFNRWVGEEDLLPDHVIGHRSDGALLICLHTHRHQYKITASELYLGCTAQARFWRPGEVWHRGNDLADGDFSEETWNRILLDIIGYELMPPVGLRDPEPLTARATQEPG